MKRFKNILVGVDLANNEQLVANKLSDATNAAIANGIWLAKHNDAKLVFFNALEVPEHARFVAEEQGHIESTLIADSEDRLAALCSAKAGEYRRRLRRSVWQELGRTHPPDPETAARPGDTGTHSAEPAASVAFGSTGMKLLRKCPCPVWITKPRERQQIASVLVADDLSPVSDLLLQLGVSMANLQQSQLHVLHALELGLGRREWDSYKIRERARTEATKKLDDQMARVGAANLTKPPRIDIVVDAADTAIIRRIDQSEIDLLVMGTVARGGIAGVLMGNTAERLLPRIHLFRLGCETA